jgi:hypothetical protein
MGVGVLRVYGGVGGVEEFGWQGKAGGALGAPSAAFMLSVNVLVAPVGVATVVSVLTARPKNAPSTGSFVAFA